MYDREVLVITAYKIGLLKTTEYRYRSTFLLPVPVPRYYFSKVPSTGTAVLLRSTVPNHCLQNAKYFLPL